MIGKILERERVFEKNLERERREFDN